MTGAFESMMTGLQEAKSFLEGQTADSIVHISSEATGEPLTYRAVVEPAGNGFSVYFPDLPGCISAGGNVAAALKNAEEALTSHLELMTEFGYEMPVPRGEGV